MVCFQNLLFYYDGEHSAKPTGVIFLEGCFCERVLNPSTGSTSGTAGVGSSNNVGSSEKMVVKKAFLKKLRDF